MLGPLQMLSHLILTVSLLSGYFVFYYLSFTVEGFAAQKVQGQLTKN